MTAQLENLVVVAKEKERLQSELDIASEVQNQLFPRSAPPTRTIELIGACEPARSVSGATTITFVCPTGIWRWPSATSRARASRRRC